MTMQKRELLESALAALRFGAFSHVLVIDLVEKKTARKSDVAKPKDDENRFFVLSQTMLREDGSGFRACLKMPKIRTAWLCEVSLRWRRFL